MTPPRQETDERFSRKPSLHNFTEVVSQRWTAGSMSVSVPGRGEEKKRQSRGSMARVSRDSKLTILRNDRGLVVRPQTPYLPPVLTLWPGLTAEFIAWHA
ncbi:hypothetical protein RRG08_038826 [Elysia crispata]|uniref:Uncharacterized protein n=1 Tax=Elysia crispata TaxID=231223 RepID=A0AAE0YS81_9GAST|nr:hypothetical protein RRG08_038826 [Elysia crispata]